MRRRLLERHAGLAPFASGSFRLFAYLGISGLLSLANSMLLLLPNLLREHGWSSQRIGWAMGCYFLVYIVACSLAGPIADRYGNVPTGLVGAGVGCVGGVFYLASLGSPWLVFAARICQAVGAGTVATAVLILLVNSVPGHLRGRVMGYYGLPGFIFLGLGPFFSEWLIQVSGFAGTFVAILLIFVTVTWILSRLPRPLAPKGTRRQFFEGLWVTLRRLGLIVALPVIFGFCYSNWSSFLALVVRSIGVGAVSSFGFGYGSGALLTRLGLSHRLDFGLRRLAGISALLVYGVGLVLIPYSTQIWHLLVLGLVCGMCHGTYYPGLSSIASERFHPLHTGQAMGLYHSASSLGLFLGPPLWGAIADISSHQTTFTAAGVLLALSTISFVLIQWRHMSRMRSSGTSTRETPLKEKRSFTR